MVTKGTWQYLGELNQQDNHGMKQPRDAVVDGYGALFVSDSQAHQIDKYNSRDRHIKRIGTQGVRAGEFEQPTHMAIDHQQRLVVVDAGNHRLQLYDLDGQWLKSIDKLLVKGKITAMLKRLLGHDPTWAPQSVTTGPDGRVYVLDSTGVIYRLNDQDQPEIISSRIKSGYHDLAIGEAAAGPTQERFMDMVNQAAGQIDKQNLEGQVLYSYTGSQAYQPAHIETGPLGNMWITDSKKHRIQVFGPFGNLLASLGQFGGGQGEFDRPQGMAFKGYQGLKSAGNNELGHEVMIYVVDSGNQRIQKFAYQPASDRQLTPQPTATPSAKLEIVGLTVQPNVLPVTAGRQSVIQYLVSRPCHLQLIIQSLAGDRIRDFGVTQVTSPGLVQTQVWNLRNQYGGLVRPDTYVVKAIARDGNQLANRQVTLTLVSPGSHEPNPTKVVTPLATATLIATSTPPPTATATPTPTPSPLILSLAINPDPFRDDATSVATISYRLSQAAIVDLLIKDNQGGVVHQILGAQGQAGYNAIQWSGTESPDTREPGPAWGWLGLPHRIELTVRSSRGQMSKTISFTKEVWRFLPTR